MATKQQLDSIVNRLRGLSLTHEQADVVREHLAICTVTQPPRVTAPTREPDPAFLQPLA